MINEQLSMINAGFAYMWLVEKVLVRHWLKPKAMEALLN